MKDPNDKQQKIYRVSESDFFKWKDHLRGAIFHRVSDDDPKVIEIMKAWPGKYTLNIIQQIEIKDEALV